MDDREQVKARIDENIKRIRFSVKVIRGASTLIQKRGGKCNGEK